MSRAKKELRPDPHECCPNAINELGMRSYVGAWTHFFRGVPIIYCPWCSVELPREQRRLTLVKGDDP